MAKGETSAQIIKKMNNEIVKIVDRTMGGMLAGGLVVQREAQKRVPVEYGALKQSAFTRKARGGMNMAVEVGFTAAYALWVHENLAMAWKGRPRRSGKGVYWGPQGEAKFLENAVVAKKDEFFEQVAKRARPQGGKR